MAGSIRNPGGEQRRATSGKTIFDYADELAVQVPTSCYRTGHCHECVVEIRQGMQALGPRTEAESFLRHEYRLACQAVIKDAEVDVLFTPLRRKPKILTVSQEKKIDLDPVVSRRGDEVLYDGEVVDRFRGHLYGLAIDLGTTTVVMELVDLETGRSLHVSSFENPQRFGGSDVMNRISYDGGQDARGELQRSVASAINCEILEMAGRLEFTRQEIYEIVVAGNSTMRDLLFKLDVQGIGQRPYKSLVEHEYLAGERRSTSLLQIARRLGLRANLKTRVYGLPLIASHVGGDTAAALVALDMDVRSDDVVVVVDVGTNTEVVVRKGDRLVAASCPAGPAFEGGAAVKFGMPGYDGAIESFRLDPEGQLTYSTIGDEDPQGICGSGLIDLLAELRRSDRLTAKGVFTEDKKLFEITVVPEAGITFSKEDASNLAQAKAANYCGQYIVLRELGVDPEDVSRLYLAGGFANYVDVGNAIDIGFLAPVPQERIVKVGNAALLGAREVLINRRRRAQLEELVKGVEHVELETTPDFFELFVDGCQLNPMPRRFTSPENDGARGPLLRGSPKAR
jgi:uncharacterized 2Fe-2S/4Fe-4S cluster protein (DUF4445 family)